ncbi:MAG TPA: hypothetical protein VGM93_14405 [Acidimicrobiales bacterium]|jgi:hypothetical protein
MARQLTLMDRPAGWRLDEQTKEIGRRGIAEARAALAAVAEQPPAHDPTDLIHTTAA